MHLYDPPHTILYRNVTYGVGQALFTTFPTMLGQDYALTTDYNLVSYDYDIVKSSMPVAEDFYVVLASLDSIRSAEFTSSHVGIHSLNVTVQDNNGARSSFYLNVTVQDAEVLGQNGQIDLKLTEDEYLTELEGLESACAELAEELASALDDKMNALDSGADEIFSVADEDALSFANSDCTDDMSAMTSVEDCFYRYTSGSNCF